MCSLRIKACFKLVKAIREVFCAAMLKPAGTLAMTKAGSDMPSAGNL